MFFLTIFSSTVSRRSLDPIYILMYYINYCPPPPPKYNEVYFVFYPIMMLRVTIMNRVKVESLTINMSESLPNFQSDPMELILDGNSGHVVHV